MATIGLLPANAVAGVQTDSSTVTGIRSKQVIPEAWAHNLGRRFFCLKVKSTVHMYHDSCGLE